MPEPRIVTGIVRGDLSTLATLGQPALQPDPEPAAPATISTRPIRVDPPNKDMDIAVALFAGPEQLTLWRKCKLDTILIQPTGPLEGITHIRILAPDETWIDMPVAPYPDGTLRSLAVNQFIKLPPPPWDIDGNAIENWDV